MKTTPWQRRGLVAGDMQSGETATYTALCFQAGDAGYRLIILLTDALERLRRQTQERLDEGFVGLDSSGELRKVRSQAKIGVGPIDRFKVPGALRLLLLSVFAGFVLATPRYVGLPPPVMHASALANVNSAIMLRLLLALLSATAATQAGVVQGHIVEFGTGLPLARARVHLDRLEGANIRRVETLYTRRGGQFTFGDVPDGLYLVSAERESYAVASYQQRRPEGYGAPFGVSKDSAEFIELRLHKLGVITGTLRDENGVGLPGVRVLAYPRRLPLRSVAQATSDDRGVYRLHGLAPGKYWVRSAAHAFSETGDALLPTFAPEVNASREARISEARLDVETAYADLRPLAGRLGAVQGTVAPCDVPGPVEVTLSTEEGNRKVQTVCGGSFKFENVSDGPRDLSALATDACLGYFEETPRLSSASVVQLQPCGPVRFERQPTLESPLFIRRRDLAGDGPWAEVKGNRPVALAAGYWEVRTQLPATHYLADVRQRRNIRSRGHHLDGFQFMSYPGTGQGVTLHLISVGGVVTVTAKPCPPRRSSCDR